MSEKTYESLVERFGEAMTAAEVAKVLKVHEQTVYKWCRNGTMPICSFLVGALRRFRTGDVAGYLTGDSVAPTPEPAEPKKRGRGRPRKAA